MKKEKVEIIKRPVERFKTGGTDPKKAAWSAMIESVITIAFGVLLMIWPNTIVRVLAYLFGGFLLVKGGFKIISYLMDRKQESWLSSDLLGGIITFLAGIVIFAVGEEIVHIFRVLVGVWIIYEALIRLCNAVRVHSVGTPTWSAMLVMSLVMLSFGLFITFFDGAMMFVIGLIMVVCGAIGLCTDVVFMQNLNALIEKLKSKK